MTKTELQAELRRVRAKLKEWEDVPKWEAPELAELLELAQKVGNTQRELELIEPHYQALRDGLGMKDYLRPLFDKLLEVEENAGNATDALIKWCKEYA